MEAMKAIEPTKKPAEPTKKPADLEPEDGTWNLKPGTLYEDAHGSLIRELDCICKQINHHLFDSLLISPSGAYRRIYVR